MKGLMLNSISGGIVTNKMRDQMYMRHLREVEKINNREPQQISKDIKNYRSINEIHHKHKLQAFQRQHKIANHQIDHNNQKIKKKIIEIKPYLQFKHSQVTSARQTPTQLDNLVEKEGMAQSRKQEITGALTRGASSPTHNKQKKRYSLHYQYRKRRQEEIEYENQKLTKSILNQRSVYLPKINSTNNHKIIAKSIDIRNARTENPPQK